MTDEPLHRLMSRLRAEQERQIRSSNRPPILNPALISHGIEVLACYRSILIENARLRDEHVKQVRNEIERLATIPEALESCAIHPAVTSSLELMKQTFAMSDETIQTLYGRLPSEVRAEAVEFVAVAVRGQGVLSLGEPTILLIKALRRTFIAERIRSQLLTNLDRFSESSLFQKFQAHQSGVDIIKWKQHAVEVVGSKSPFARAAATFRLLQDLLELADPSRWVHWLLRNIEILSHVMDDTSFLPEDAQAFADVLPDIEESLQSVERENDILVQGIMEWEQA